MASFVDDVDSFVLESCRGLVAAHSEITLREDPLFVFRQPEAGTVALVSGGGSGHEPMHCGFVGPGMLAAACPGLIFTSPTVDQIVKATLAVAGPAGALFIVKNYTGDVLAFESASELLMENGVSTRSVLVRDDVAISESEGGPGRRGVAGTLVVEKVLGAAAAMGADLEELASLGDEMGAVTRSIGVGLSSCELPGRGKPLFDLPAGHVEFGIGIHGESGRTRDLLPPASVLAKELAVAVVSEIPRSSGSSVLLFTNGFGASPLAELQLLHYHVMGSLASLGVTVKRHLVGNYVTSLNMAGASVTLAALDERLLRLWDAPVDTPALRW